MNSSLFNKVDFFIRICVILGCILLITSCDHAPSSISPRDAIALLTKCKDFMSFCILILNQSSDVYYNQFSSRYYYAIYMLGRIVSGPRRFFSREEGDMTSHKKVWDSCPQKTKETYGTQLKNLRVKSDYGMATPDLEHSGHPLLLNQLVGNDEAFKELIEQVDDVCSGVSSRPDYQEKYIELLEEIKELRGKIRTKLSSLIRNVNR